MEIFGSPILERYPSLIPTMLSQSCKSVKETNPAGKVFQELPYAIHFQYAIDTTPARNMEFAFPFDINDKISFQKVLQALKVVIELAEKDASAGMFVKIIYIGCISLYKIIIY